MDRGGIMDYYLAIDIGASSGRHMVFSKDDDKLIMEEIYRFENKMIEENGHVHWDIETMFQHIIEGMKLCKTLYKIPKSVGIDTWAVDYVLLDKDMQRLNNPYAYRDSRTNEVIDTVHQRLSQAELYEKTGIQFQPFNTVYQLDSENKETLKKAKHFLMIPDYLHYRLTGKMTNEFTNISTTQLLNARTQKFDDDILAAINVDKDIFEEIVDPGTCIGSFQEEIIKAVGYDSNVIVPTTHDSACAYFGAINKDGIILSSGTWSLLGLIEANAIISEESKIANFTNEGGYNRQFRFLKNIMGLWIIQEVSRCYEGMYSFVDLVELAKQSEFDGVFDVNDNRFLKPKNMVESIQEYFKERDEIVPETAGEIAYSVYHSLALSYKHAVDELEAITRKTYNTINVVGGGCKNELLNEMLAKYTGKEVIVGPSEATAIGNVLAQYIYDDVIKDETEIENLLKRSFEIKTYKGGSIHD